MGGTIASQRASYYGADDRLVAADARTPGKQLVEAVRYDALGRRVWVSTRWRCAPSADVACIANAVTRTLWDGASEVAEIRARYDTSAAAMEEMDAGADTVPKSIVGDANPFYGRVVYGPALALDQPLSVTRYEYRDNPYGADALAWPTFTLVPFWDYRGTPVFGLFSDGAYARPYAAGGSSCPGSPGTGTTDRCVYLTWPFAGSAYHQDRGQVFTFSWHGSLLLKKRDVSGLTYARNRMYDPGTGRFTQEDPIGLAGGLNAYGFAGGDPVNYADPAGLCPIGSDKFANTACPHHAENFQSWYSRQGLQDAGLFDPTILLSGGISAGIRFLGARMLGQAAVVATVEETAATRLAANKEAGDLFRDEIAEIFRKAGYYVRLEVTKQTMFGRRVIDIEISRGGVILGGIETKWGLARYNASQQAKDAYLRLFKDYIVQVVRPQ